MKPVDRINEVVHLGQGQQFGVGGAQDLGFGWRRGHEGRADQRHLAKLQVIEIKGFQRGLGHPGSGGQHPEIAEVEPGVWEMTALLVGPGARARRAPRALTALMPGRRIVRVDAADVASTGNHVRLMKKAAELGVETLSEDAWLQLIGQG